MSHNQHRRALLGITGISLMGAALLGKTVIAAENHNSEPNMEEGYIFPMPPPVSLSIAIGSLAMDVAEEHALEHVFGYAVGNDLTRRDLMMAAMNAGGAVDVGKSFDYSAPCGSVYPVSSAGHVENAHIWITVDGEIKQEGNTGDMLKKPARLIAALSRLFHLQPGDMIYTGTPGLTSSVAPGQTMVCGIVGLGTLTNKVIKVI